MVYYKGFFLFFGVFVILTIFDYLVYGTWEYSIYNSILASFLSLLLILDDLNKKLEMIKNEKR